MGWLEDIITSIEQKLELLDEFEKTINRDFKKWQDNPGFLKKMLLSSVNGWKQAEQESLARWRERYKEKKHLSGR